jgi:hypothetical protein
MNAQRYGNWSGNCSNASNYGSHTARRAAKTSKYYGITFCSWRGRHGEWSAAMSADRNDPRSKRIVIGYYKKETEAIEARKQAMASRHTDTSDAATKRKRERDDRRKVNRMHTARTLMGDATSTIKYQPSAQHKKLPDLENTSLPLITGRTSYSTSMDVSMDYNISNNRTKKSNKLFKRENMLDITQLQRYDRLDRERRRFEGPASYNNAFQRQHSWLPRQAALASFRRRQRAKHH